MSKTPKAPRSRKSWSPAPLVQFSLALHGVAMWALMRRPHRWRTIGRVLFADHVLLCAAGTWPRSGLLGPNLRRFDAESLMENGLPANGVVLTFDDGPDPQVTPQVLDILEHHGARASFFCIGQRAEKYPDLLREIVRRGHGIGNHTYQHTHDFAFRTFALGREVDHAQEVYQRILGKQPKYFRAPAGMRNPFLDPVLHARNLQLTSWTRRGFDTAEKDPSKVVRRLTARLAAGDILLLHDGNSARDSSGRPVVLEVLPRLLGKIKEFHLQAVALPEGEEAPIPG